MTNYDIHDWADEERWPLPELTRTIKTLVLEQEVANSRKKAELEPIIGHAVYELWSRRQETK